ncbi:DUF3592 domain-containing protein [Rhodobacteraceae bacterium NNCM2]|nr:DUF3592 domain-containing protein [Coraliihabitans acroporae]
MTVEGAEDETEQRPVRYSKYFAIAFGLMALLFAGIGGWQAYDVARFMEVAQPARGTVVSVDVEHSDDGVSYTPTITYEDAAGAPQSGETHISSSGYDYPIGQQVDILYHPDWPGEVRINSFVSLYLLPMIFLFVGLFLLVLVTIGVVKMRSGKATSAAPAPGADPEPNRNPDVVRRMR